MPVESDRVSDLESEIPNLYVFFDGYVVKHRIVRRVERQRHRIQCRLASNAVERRRGDGRGTGQKPVSRSGSNVSTGGKLQRRGASACLCRAANSSSPCRFLSGSPLKDIP